MLTFVPDFFSAMNSSSNNKALLALGIVSFFWGTTYLASRIGAQEMPGLFLAALRQFISGTILLVYFLGIKRYSIPDRTTLKKIFTQGFFMLVLGNGLSTWSVQYISSGLAAIIAALIPLLVVLFSIVMLKNASFTRNIIIGLLIGLAGITAIFYEYLSDLLNPDYAFGLILNLVAISCWAFGTVYTSKNKLQIDVLYGVGWQMFLSGCIMLPASFLLGQTSDFTGVHLDGFLSLAYLIIIGSLLCYSAYVYSIKHLPPARATIYAYINPIIAVFLGWLVLDERLNLNVGFGTAITIVGVYLVNNEFRKQVNISSGKNVKENTRIPELIEEKGSFTTLPLEKGELKRD
ncbi:MAG: EamA family transporter [Chitinophagales bacterium]|nr:EamA family transporter [Chitinophagales bacterium]